MRSFSPRTFIAVTLAAPALLAVALAQESLQAHIDIGPLKAASTVEAAAPMRFDVNLVMVNVTVTDQKSRPVLKLQSNNFQVFEADQPQQIRYFSSEDAPLSVGLVIDFSASMADKIDILRESVRQFFDNANPLDEYYVVAVSTRPKLLVSGTRSIREIENKLSEEVPEGMTALHDSVDLVVREMKHARYERRAVVIISDGGDTSSHLSLKKIVKRVEESNADLYAIAAIGSSFFFLRPPETMIGLRDLSRMTGATGGRTISVDNASRVPKAIADLSLELRNQYVLAYRPTNLERDGKWRKVKVRVVPPNEEDRFVAHFKKGYRAPTD